MRGLQDFTKQFTGKKVIDPKKLLFVEGKVFLVSEEEKTVAIIEDSLGRKPHSVGLFLGKQKGRTFFPSINLLNLVARFTKQKVWLHSEASWLYVCGRDVFKEGISKYTCLEQKGTLVLLLNTFDEIIGFGKIVKKLTHKGGDGIVFIENIFDVGDFLRREKNKGDFSSRGYKKSNKR